MPCLLRASGARPVWGWKKGRPVAGSIGWSAAYSAALRLASALSLAACNLHGEPMRRAAAMDRQWNLTVDKYSRPDSMQLCQKREVVSVVISLHLATIVSKLLVHYKHGKFAEGWLTELAHKMPTSLQGCQWTCGQGARRPCPSRARGG